MIKNGTTLEKWQKKQLRNEPTDYFRNLQLYEEMYQEARLLKILPLANPMEGLESKIRLAERLNVSRNPAKTGTGSR